MLVPPAGAVWVLLFIHVLQSESECRQKTTALSNSSSGIVLVLLLLMPSNQKIRVYDIAYQQFQC
jgi:hypothetical protein